MGTGTVPAPPGVCLPVQSACPVCPEVSRLPRCLFTGTVLYEDTSVTKVRTNCDGAARGGAGSHAGRAGGRESAAHAARPAPSTAPSHARRSTLSAPGQDRLLRSGVGPLVLVVNLSPDRRCLWSAIDGSRATTRDRRRDGLGTFACAAAPDRSAVSATPARARRQRIQPFAGATTAFDGARTSPPEQPA